LANWGWFSAAHRALYRASGGRIGGRLMGIPMLLLTTTGRRSGAPRSTPLACYEDADDLVVVGSNNGQDHHPAWWLNLEKHPEAQVQFGSERRDVRASLASTPERARLWPLLTRHNPHYAGYERKTRREIPVVILRRRA
jgi:deazaflavin-dependent oxidoreductase (nitroreductase family)